MLQPGFQQAPDGDARMAAIGRTYAALIEQLAQQWYRVGRGNHQALARAQRLQLGEQFGCHAPIRPTPGTIAGQLLSGLRECFGEARQ